MKRIKVVCMFAAFLAAGTEAHAQCSMGYAIKGTFAFAMHGLVTAGGAEAAVGLIKSSGSCSLTGSMTIDTNGTITASKLKGSYSVNPDLSASMSILPAGSSGPITFDVKVGSKGREITGIESDNLALSVIDLKSQGGGTFSNATLTGTYNSLCIADTTNKEIQSALTTYDGAGNLTGYTDYAFLNSGANVGNFTGQYVVSSNGTFKTALAGNNGIFTNYGVLYNSGTQIFNIVDGGNGVDLNYCTAVKQ